MDIVVPIAIAGSVLSATNVIETAPTAYSGGTTYALGNTVSVAAGTVLSVYQSLQSANIGHTPSSSPTWWKLIGTTYAVYASGSTYNLNDIVIDPVAHHAYASVVASNTGNPLTNATKWVDLGADNTWAMFDPLVQSQTTNPDSIAVTVLVPGRIDTVALLNISGASAHITLTDAIEGVVFDETFSLVSDSGIDDPYAYSFYPIVRLRDLIVTGLPPYANATLSVAILAPGETVACGDLVIGLADNIGGTQYGSKIGIVDYSIKQADAFGNFTIVQRTFSKTSEFTIFVDAGSSDAVAAMLEDLRATPVLYIGSDVYSSTVILGFYTDWTVEFTYTTTSVCTLQLEGIG